MPSPRDNLLDSLFKCLEENGYLYHCNDNLAFLDCAPGEKRKYRFIVEVEEESGEKKAHMVIYYEPKPGTETSTGEPMPSPRTFERKKSTTTTTSAILGSHTSAPADSCRSPEQGASGGPASAKRQRTSNNRAISITTSKVNDRQTTHTPLQLRDTNSTFTYRLLVPKPKATPSSISNTVSPPAMIEDERADYAQDPKDKAARDVHHNTLEAATFASLPNIFEYEFNKPIRLRISKTDARSVERMEKIAEFARRIEEIKDKDTYGRLLMMSLCIAFAEFLWEILQEKGQTFNPNQTRPSRSKQKKYGRWDIDRNDLTAALNAILQIDPEKIREADAKRYMKEIHKGKDPQRPGNYKMRSAALEMWCLGSKLCIFRDEAGPAALVFLTLGPPSLPKYSLDIRIGRNPMFCHREFIEGPMKLIRQDRHIFTAMADQKLPWRPLMEQLSIPINMTLDPPRVQLGKRFYRGPFNKETMTYNVKLFSPNENKNYIANRVVESCRSVIHQHWEEHLDHDPWCREHPCCAVYEPNPPIQVFDTEISVLGKGLRATQRLRPGNYVAEHAGICKPAAECSDDEDEEDEEDEKDRMEILIPGEGKYYIYQDEKWSMIKYMNYSSTPNIEWVHEVVDGIACILLRVKDSCDIYPGDELTAHYGEQYWRGKANYTGPKFLLH